MSCVHMCFKACTAVLRPQDEEMLDAVEAARQ